MEEELYKRILDSFPNSKRLGIKRVYHAGQSGAPVFAVQYKRLNNYGLNGAFIVKIGSQEWASKEAALHKSLSSSALAPLLAHGHMPSNVVEEHAAVAYDIAFDSLYLPRSMRDILHDRGGQSEEETQSQIENLSQALVKWYLNDNLADNSVVEDPYTLLVRMLTERRVSDLFERLKDTLPFWSSDTLQITVQGLNTRLPNPLAYMRKGTWQKIKPEIGLHCPLGRIHGDLHTGNIICFPKSQPLPNIIDFDQSEIGVPFFDLAYLEFDTMRQLLPIEHKENREHWLALLNFSMNEEIEGEQRALHWNVVRAWDFIKPIRQEMQRLQISGGEDYSIVRWLATVAVGLNFARKGGLGRSSFERMAGLLYAAYGLACTLKGLRVREEMTEQTPFVLWLDGYGKASFPPDLHISQASQESSPEAFSKIVDQPLPIETSQDTGQMPSQPASLNLSLDQSLSVSPESVMKLSEGAVSLSNKANGNTMEASRPGTEYMPEATEKSALCTDVENAPVEPAEQILSLLQSSLNRFNGGGLIHRDICKSTDSILQQLEVYLLAATHQKTAQTPYEVRFLLDSVLVLQKKVRSDLQDFQKICPPLNRNKLHPHYDKKRSAIARMLNDTLAKFRELLKKFE
jgi:hypothetical protein